MMDSCWDPVSPLEGDPVSPFEGDPGPPLLPVSTLESDDGPRSGSQRSLFFSIFRPDCLLVVSCGQLAI